MKKKSSEFYECAECKDGKIEVITIQRGDDISIEVKRCNSCKKQYGLKAILKLLKIEE